MVVPFINQIPRLLLVSTQRTSALPSPLKSPVPATDHWVGIELKLPACVMVVPFISHIPTSWLVSSQRMSEKPSPLKSCVALGLKLGAAKTHAAPANPLSQHP